MRLLHERFLEGIAEEGRRLASRRSFVVGSARLAAGSAVALTLVGGNGYRRFAAAQDFASDIGVLNYALTLEQLEATFYREGLEGFAPEDFDADVFDNLAVIGGHEEAHVVLLSDTISQLGGEPVEEAEYDFGGAFSDPGAFLETAQALENTGVSAYDGAAQFLSDPNLLTTAGGIVAVEARHASYLNDLNRDVPFPDSFETPLTPAEVLNIADQFIIN
jgi:rubrerythrin